MNFKSIIVTTYAIDSTSNTLASDTILQLQSDTSREFEVIEVVSSNNTILLNGLNNYTLEEDDVLYEPNTASEFTITLINNLPTINKFSGDLIFLFVNKIKNMMRKIVSIEASKK